MTTSLTLRHGSGRVIGLGSDAGRSSSQPAAAYSLSPPSRDEPNACLYAQPARWFPDHEHGEGDQSREGLMRLSQHGLYISDPFPSQPTPDRNPESNRRVR
ncbi:MAG: hypothetical protein HBSAPP03_05940 [Phycisphaerae bacterium]|nr:MAG: hypothetical protein HBSAPP03_05940 [Phycisphaerae bacterium]